MKQKKCFNLLLPVTALLSLIMPSAYSQSIYRDTLILHFSFNRHDLSAKNINDLGCYLNDSNFINKKIDSINIIGHADTVGSAKYNFNLSLQRANAVNDYFKKKSLRISADKFRLAGMGEENADETVDSLNRKAEIIFIYGLKTDKIIAGDILINHEIDTNFFLPDINFVEDRPILTGSSQIALPSRINSLKKYKDRFITIKGYANYQKSNFGKDDPLFKLSVERAKLIYDYLIEAGFDPKKLSYEGMGNSDLKNTNPANLEQMRQNMRVLIEVRKQ